MDVAIYDQDPVRFELMRHLGAFCTEGSGHDSEYLPYFRKRPDLVQKYDRRGYVGESGFYANNWPTWVEESAQFLRDYLSGLDWNKEPPPPALPGDILARTQARYEEALQRITG